MRERCRSPWGNKLEKMIYKISHRTTYKYVYPVSFGNHVACLKPRSFARNQLVCNELHIHPAPTTCTERVDYFGNQLCFFTIEEPHEELTVEARSEVVIDRGHDAATQSLPWEESAKLLAEDHTESALEAHQFQFESPRIRMRPEFAAYALESFTPGRPMREALRELTARIHKDFCFDSKVTTVRTPTEEVFKKRRGVCQDFAHIQIACLRSIRAGSALCEWLPADLSAARQSRASSVLMLRTPGSLPTAAASAGSTWTPPTTSPRPTGT